MLFQQMAKAQDDGFARHAGGPGIQAGKLAVQRNVVQRLFHGPARRANQFSSRDYQVHFVQKFAFARPLGHQFKSAVGKAYSLQGCSTCEAMVGLTYAESPKTTQ